MCVFYSIVRDICRDVFVNMERLGMFYFDRILVGFIVLCIINDIEVIFDMFLGILLSFILVIFIFIVILYIMLMLDIKLIGFVVFLLFVIFILVNVYWKKLVIVIVKMRSLFSDINSKLLESIEGICIV